MRIGITADLHLTSKDKHPERSHALCNILQICKEDGVESLIIAGDLFDTPLSNYSEFEAICRSREFSSIQLLIIPGNHDQTLGHKQVAAKNAHIFEEPARQKLGDGWDACFVPYRDGQTMCKSIGDLVEPGDDSRWSLIGHGDWLDDLGPPNPYEPSKVYMPLTRKELDLFKPSCTFLGHIHAPQKSGGVYYAGSPCPVASNETGYRRFLVLDTDTGMVDEKRVDSDVLYFSARLMVMPGSDEQELLTCQVQECKRAWALSESDAKKARVRIEAVGFSNDRTAVLRTIEKGFCEFAFFEEPDLSQLNAAGDLDRNSIILQFQNALEAVDYPFGCEDQPDKYQIILKAMELVYGRV